MKKSYCIVLILFIIALASFNIYLLINSDLFNKTEKEDKAKCYVSEKLSLNKEQALKYEDIKKRHLPIVLQYTDSLHVTQEKMMEYFEKGGEDKSVVLNYENLIAEYQRMLLNQTLEQYFELKSILRPDQIIHMDKLYRQMLVCRPTCNHQKEGCTTHPLHN